MRYVITPIKVPDPSDESGKKKREALCAEVWPGPWSTEEYTAEERSRHSCLTATRRA